MVYLGVRAIYVKRAERSWASMGREAQLTSRSSPVFTS
jgi:hypothetical protein